MELKIRLAQHDDLDALVEIYNQAIEMRYSTAYTHPVDLHDRMQWYKEHEGTNYPIYVAENNGIVVGCISLSPYRKDREALKHTAEISYYIHNEFKRKGLATKLVDEIIVRAKKLGYKTLIAILIKENTASIKLLEKFEFKEWGFLPDVVEIDGKTYGHSFYGRKI